MTIKTYPSHSWLKAANKHYDNALPYCNKSLVANSLFFVGSAIGMLLAMYPTTMITGTLTITILVGSISSIVGGATNGALGALAGGVTVLGAACIALYKYDGKDNPDETHDLPAANTIGVMKEAFLYGWDLIIGKSLHYTLDPAKYIVETVFDHFISSTKAQDELAGENAASQENLGHD